MAVTKVADRQTVQNVDLTSEVTGTLPVGNGGVGAATLAANNVLLGNGTSALQVVAPSTSGNVLTSNGTTWTSAAPGSGSGAPPIYLTVGPTGDSSYVTDGTADNVQIQAAITALASTGGVVQLQKGTYNLAAGLTISSSNITLQGVGFGSTKLFLNNSVNATTLTISGTGTIGVGVFDLTIDGNKANQTSGSGISINTPYSTTDTMHFLRNIDIVNAKDEGIVITGDTRVVRMFMVRTRSAGMNGYSLAGSDHQIFNCVADAAARSGFVIYCTNGAFFGCKAFFCDSAVSGYSGFRVEGQRNVFVSCEAQDNNEHGWRIISAHGSILNGCIGDSNGTNYTDAGSGLSLESSNNCSVIGGAWLDRAAAVNHQKYGIVVTGSPTGCEIFGGAFYGNATAATSGVTGAVALTADVSGTLPVGNGGTGVATLTGLVKASGTSAFTAATAGTDYVSPAGTENISGKRIQPRVVSPSVAGTYTVDWTNCDQYVIGPQTAAITNLTATGTAQDGQKLMMRIKGDATPRAITWDSAKYVSSGVATLLATTAASKTHFVGLIYDGVLAKMVCVAVDATGY